MVKAALVKLVFGIWTAMAAVPGQKPPGDAPAIADAIATVILENAHRRPVLGSHNEDAAAMSYWADKESNVQVHPAHWIDPRTGKPVDSLAFGTYQTHRLGNDASAIDYARDWRRQLRDGKKVCPESPLAPLSGSCHLARPLADRRAREMRKLFVQALATLDPESELVQASAE